MQDLPDAPWIRDAENNGWQYGDPVYCPICGDEADEFYLQDGTVIGCNNCVECTEASKAFLD